MAYSVRSWGRDPLAMCRMWWYLIQAQRRYDTPEGTTGMTAMVKSLFRLVLAAVLLATTMLGGCHRAAPGNAVEGNAVEDIGQVQQQKWVLRAEGLLARLGALADTCPKVEPRSWEEVLASRESVWSSIGASGRTKRGDRLLWRLWLATGTPPLLPVSADETQRSLFQRNAVAYRQYIDRNRYLSEGDLHTAGLANAAVAVGTPLWYPALQYFDRITGALPVGDFLIIHSTPGYFVLGWESLTPLTLQKQTSDVIASALSAWVEANRGRMLWHCESRRFWPRDGECVGDEALMKQVGETLWLRF